MTNELKALEVTKEIVVAKIPGTIDNVCAVTGEQIGEMFEAIYNKVLSILNQEKS